MLQRRRYPNYRTISSIRKNGFLVIKINAVSNRGFYASALLIISAFFAGTCWSFAQMLHKVRTLTEALAFLLVFAFVLLWFVVGSRIILQRLSSIELFAGSGMFRFSHQVLRWRKDIEVPQQDVSAVTATVRWYGNRLNITMNGKTYSVGDLLDEDVAIIDKELRRALPALR